MEVIRSWKKINTLRHVKRAMLRARLRARLECFKCAFKSYLEFQEIKRKAEMAKKNAEKDKCFDKQ